MSELFFTGTAELCAALRLCDDAESWRRAARRLQLRDRDGRLAWLLEVDGELTGVRPTQATVQRQGDRLEVRQNGEGAVYEVVEERHAPSLLQAVPLQPVSASTTDQVTYVAVGDGEWFTAVAQANLLLGNDRMGYLPLGDGAALLRIEGLSEFLRRKWAAEPALRFYQPSDADARFLLPFGYAHPLADKLRLVPGGDQDLWLAESVERWRHLRGGLRDIYDRIEVDAEQFVVEPAAAADAPRVTVELRLETAERLERPQLWYLRDDERPVLERLLREADEGELNTLQVAGLTHRDGRRAYLVVERLSGAVGLAPPIRGGLAYYARLGEERLYVPVGQRLLPVLSRRTMVEALGLAESRLTLLRDAGQGRIEVLRVPAEALRPVADIVDYFAGEAADELTGLLAAVTFDHDLTTEAEGAAVDGGRGPLAWLGRWFGRG